MVVSHEEDERPLELFVVDEVVPDCAAMLATH
jgi:hypothetical protein